jgi:hypothetical protein
VIGVAAFIRLWMLVFSWFIWACVTVWLGLWAIVRLVRLLVRLPALLSSELRCPRGHRLPAYGVYHCACKAVHEGHIWGRCAVCRQSAGYTPCPECGRPVRNSLLGLLS